ncbi:MAG: DsrE family protein [Chloroflexi bacterium]|nr:DsrE family protein [Chloroflexota bacterium]
MNNLTRDYPEAQVRVVANGTGVYAFLGQSDLVERLKEVADKGVALQVCRNSLHEHHVDAVALPPFAVLVRAGVVALAESQQNGFAYIKP